MPWLRNFVNRGLLLRSGYRVVLVGYDGFGLVILLDFRSLSKLYKNATSGEGGNGLGFRGTDASVAH